MKLREIVKVIEDFAPLSFQESYDNAGLITGNPDMNISGALLSIDITEDVISEALRLNCNMIISHHPVIFKGLKKITGKSFVERVIISAIKNDIAIYAAHTNIDSVTGGVNSMICQKLGLVDCEILQPRENELFKLVTFVPVAHAEDVRVKIFEAGAGTIGNYDNCSFNQNGYGTFRANEASNPFVGEKGKVHSEDEVRVETIFPLFLRNKIINTLIKSHPYEEVAYDIYPLANNWNQVGMGMTGFLNQPLSENTFLSQIKEIFKLEVIRHTRLLNKEIKKVAVCGGSGSFLLKNAISSNADIFITGDFKYHEFFDAEDKLVIADIGHYESEQFTKEVFYDLLIKKLPKFAVCLSETDTNPVKYYK